MRAPGSPRGTWRGGPGRHAPAVGWERRPSGSAGPSGTWRGSPGRPALADRCEHQGRRAEHDAADRGVLRWRIDASTRVAARNMARRPGASCSGGGLGAAAFRVRGAERNMARQPGASCPGGSMRAPGGRAEPRRGSAVDPAPAWLTGPSGRPGIALPQMRRGSPRAVWRTGQRQARRSKMSCDRRLAGRAACSGFTAHEAGVTAGSRGGDEDHRGSARGAAARARRSSAQPGARRAAASRPRGPALACGRCLPRCASALCSPTRP